MFNIDGFIRVYYTSKKINFKLYKTTWWNFGKINLPLIVLPIVDE